MNRLLDLCVRLTIFLLVANLSCKNKEISMPPTVQGNPIVVKVSPTINNVVPYQVASFLLDSTTSYRLNTYEAYIGKQKVPIGRYKNNFSFITPDLSPGPYVLETLIEGKQYQIAYVIGERIKVTNPEALVSQHTKRLDSITVVFENLLKSDKFSANLGVSETNLSLLKSYTEQFKQAATKASASERIELANFLAANQQLFNSQIIGGGRRAADATEFDYDSFYERAEPKIDVYTNRLAFLIVVGTAVSLGGGGLPGIIITAAAASFVVAQIIRDIIGPVLKEYAKQRIGAVVKQIDPFSSGGRKASTLTFVADQAAALTIEAPYQTLQNQDLNSSFRLLRDVAQKFTVLVKLLTDINSLLPTPFVFDLDLTKQPADTKVQLVSPSLLSVSNVSNPNVKLKKISTKNEKLIVTFVLEKGEKEKFTFDLTYDNPGVSKSTTTFEAEITSDLADYNDTFFTFKLNGIEYVKVDPNCTAGDGRGSYVSKTGSKLRAVRSSQFDYPNLALYFDPYHPNDKSSRPGFNGLGTYPISITGVDARLSLLGRPEFGGSTERTSSKGTLKITKIRKIKGSDLQEMIEGEFSFIAVESLGYPPPNDIGISINVTDGKFRVRF